jgi:hypothetical protein
MVSALDDRAHGPDHHCWELVSIPSAVDYDSGQWGDWRVVVVFFDCDAAISSGNGGARRSGLVPDPSEDPLIRNSTKFYEILRN